MAANQRAAFKEDMSKLGGSIVALVTPMRPEAPFAVDFEALKKLVDWHVAEGTDAIVAVGTTGEAATLSSSEWEDVVSACVSASAGRLAVIAGTGSNCTATAIEKTKKARDLGADAALIVTPYYNKPTQEGIFQHYQAITRAVPDFPIITYNVPGRTACDMLPETLARIVKACSNVVGHKEASGKFERFELIRKLVGKEFRIFSGEDAQSCAAMLAGACDGVISVTANVVPGQMHLMCRYALEKSEKAADVDTKLMALHEGLFVEPNPTAAKWLLADMGYIQGGIRLPLLPLSRDHERLRHALKEARDVPLRA
ncbi:dihydrodipicolinate synthase [Cystoisospora suis]|uniref:4-hydroxy-tetrahydrodipicolinate synthase n=1 Tax=Cystoisospora suis TaxID=483139 RepID=A0A2C6LAY2_9APIC|nr:dihydrodipicolinate synthase [Cystoisospora suis]